MNVLFQLPFSPIHVAQRLSYVSIRFQFQSCIICWQSSAINDFAHVHAKYSIVIQNFDFLRWRAIIILTMYGTSTDFSRTNRPDIVGIVINLHDRRGCRCNTDFILSHTRASAKLQSWLEWKFNLGISWCYKLHTCIHYGRFHFSHPHLRHCTLVFLQYCHCHPDHRAEVSVNVQVISFVIQGNYTIHYNYRFTFGGSACYACLSLTLCSVAWMFAATLRPTCFGVFTEKSFLRSHYSLVGWWQSLRCRLCFMTKRHIWFRIIELHIKKYYMFVVYWMSMTFSAPWHARKINERILLPVRRCKCRHYGRSSIARSAGDTVPLSSC